MRKNYAIDLLEKKQKVVKEKITGMEELQAEGETIKEEALLIYRQDYMELDVAIKTLKKESRKAKTKDVRKTAEEVFAKMTNYLKKKQTTGVTEKEKEAMRHIIEQCEEQLQQVKNHTLDEVQTIERVMESYHSIL